MTRRDTTGCRSSLSPRCTFVVNTGTYVDSPRHRFRAAIDLAGLRLEQLADVPVVVADVTQIGRAIGPDAVPAGDLHGKAVLFRTDFSRHWGTDSYFHGNPFLTAEASDKLATAGAAFVGIDSLNIDDVADMSRPHDPPRRDRLRRRTPACSPHRMGRRCHLPGPRVLGS